MRHLKPLLLQLALSLILAACPSPPQVDESHRETGLVIHVFDGDTLLVRINNSEEKVRLLGIDTPETDGPYTKAEPLGEKASRLTKKLVFNKSVTLVYGGTSRRDKHGRLLAHVIMPDGRVLNEILLKEGMAEFFRKFRYTRKERYKKLEAEARRSCKGIWRLRPPCSTKKSYRPQKLHKLVRLRDRRPA